MIFAAHAPRAPLSSFVDRMWFYDGYQPQHTMERLLPDGTAEVIIDLQDHPKRLYDRDDYSRFQAFSRSWISGKQTRHIVIEAAPRSSMIGIHFKPGGSFPFLQFPVSELTGQVLPLDVVWGNQVHVLREQLLEAETPRAKFMILEQFLLRRSGDRLTTSQVVEYGVSLLMRSPHGMAIRELAGVIGVTQKRLINQFDQFVGLKPKLFGRICKFQRVLQTIDRRSQPKWACLAAELGYYDQPHFIREFQSFSGLTPSAYLTDKGEYPNFVPIRS